MKRFAVWVPPKFALLLTRNTPKTVVKIESDVETRIIFKQTRLRHVPGEARV